jgi:hypothetical protein
MVNLRLRGNGNINDNNYGFSSNYDGNIGIGNRHYQYSTTPSRSNPVNLVDREGRGENNISSISSSTTVCHNCLGSMSYDSIKDVWYCPKCRHSNNKTTTTTTASTTITNFKDDDGDAYGNNDKPVMTGGRTQSDNAEDDDTTEHIFASGHTKTRKEIQVQRQREKEFGDTSDLDPYLKKVGGYIVRQETHLPKGDYDTYDRNEWENMRQKRISYNNSNNTSYYVH